MSESALPLQLGDEGAAVRDLQDRLASVGFSIDGDSAGRFGPGTDGAIRSFQAKRGLEIDGICGPQTWAALVEAGWQLGDRLLYRRKEMLRGDDVADLQRRLSALGFDTGRVDGIFGPDTARALADFQRNAGLTSDAICGPETVLALHRLGQRTTESNPVATLREEEALRSRIAQFVGARVAVGETGGMSALADAIGRHLTHAGADALVLHDPDDSRLAAQANAWNAEVFVALRIAPVPSLAYYGRSDYESVGGRALAHLVTAAFAGRGGLELPAPRPMTVPILRETRMPAISITFDDGPLVVSSIVEISEAVTSAVSLWFTGPADLTT